MAVVARRRHVRYFSGWSAALPGALVVQPTTAVLIVPEGTGGAQAAAIAGVELHEYRAYEVSELVDGKGIVAHIVRDAVRAATPVGADRRMASDLTGWDPTASVVDIAPFIRALRRVKDDTEIDILRDRVRRLEAAFAVARDAVQPGFSETQLRDAIHGVIQGSTAEPLRLDANVGSGPRSALSDPHATDRVMADGDLVLIDMYPELDGMVADLTRTFVVGRATNTQQDRWTVVREVLAAAEELLVPGTPVRQVDRVVRERLRRAGTGELPHHVGHGIGLDPWEAPWIGSTTDHVLEVGNVIAIEPGLYVEAWGGMRLEANYVIRANGPERLDTFPDTLIGH